MHDFSISQQIAREVIKKIDAERASEVLEVKIRVGELTHLNPEQLTFWLKEFFRKTPAQEARILIKKSPLVIQCPRCQYQGNVKIVENIPLFYLFGTMRCPHCNSPEIDIQSGKECVLERITIQRAV